MTSAKDIRGRHTGREPTTKRRSRGGHNTGTEQTVLVVAGLGAVLLFALLAIAIGNRKPPPPPPAKGGINIVYEDQKTENVAGDDMPRTSTKKKKRRQEAGGDKEETQTKPKTARRVQEDDEYTAEKPRSISRRPADLEEGENVPVPSWMRDNDGRDLTKEGAPIVQPALQTEKPVSTDPKEEDEPDRVRTKEGKSTFSPWNSGESDGEIP